MNAESEVERDGRVLRENKDERDGRVLRENEDEQRALRENEEQRGKLNGFTLVELLVVLVILGLLAALVGPRVIGYLGGARADTARLQIEALSSALDLYRIDTGTYPDTRQGLEALIEDPGGVRGWRGPYLDSKEVPLDPWGRDYVYRNAGGGGDAEIVSLGADGQAGGDGEDADITTN